MRKQTSKAETPTRERITRERESQKSPQWRERYTVHPAADVFPMVSDEEIDKIGSDIAAHGLQQQLVMWRGFLVDGRNRLEAMERRGIKLEKQKGVMRFHRHLADDADPVAFVISANIHRRQLTKRQQVTLIARAVEAGEQATGRRSFNPTTGRKGGSTPDPIVSEVVAQAEKQGISRRTAERALADERGPSRRRAAPSRVQPAARPPVEEKIDDAEFILRLMQQAGMRLANISSSMLTRVRPGAEHRAALSALAARLSPLEAWAAGEDPETVVTDDGSVAGRD